MELVWALREDDEEYGSVRGGIGNERIKFRFNLERPGYYYFTASLPRSLNDSKAPGIFYKWRQKSAKGTLLDFDLLVSNEYSTFVKKKFKLEFKQKNSVYLCFEVLSGYVPATVEVLIEGHSLSKKLKPTATLHRYGNAPKTSKDKAIVARIGQYLMDVSLGEGREDLEQIKMREKKALVQETQKTDLFQFDNGLDPAPAKSVKSEDTVDPKHSVFEVLSTDAIGDAMFYLLDKGVLSAPVWDKEQGTYLGLFDVKDAMNFTFKLREISRKRKSRRVAGDLFIYGITVGEFESSCCFGLDLPVSIFFRDDNHRIAPWVPLGVASPMSEVLKLLKEQTPRVPVIDPRDDKRVVKVISQSEIINQIFYRYISPKLEPKKRNYFKSTDLCDDLVRRGIKHVFHRDDQLGAALAKTSSITVVPVVDESGVLIDSITAADAWFFCKAVIESGSEDDGTIDMLPVREFLERANKLSQARLVKARKPLVTVAPGACLETIISKLVQHKVHHVFIISDAPDSKGAPVGIVSVSDIVRVIVEDDVGIFQPWDLVADVFMWNRSTPAPSRPSVNESVQAAARRSKHRRQKTRSIGATADLLHRQTSVSSNGPHPPAPADLYRSSSAASSTSVCSETVRKAVAAGAPKREKNSLAQFAPATSYGILDPEHEAALEPYLPPALSGASWKAAYELRIQGASVLALKQALANLDIPLVLVVEDSRGFVFGGFLPGGLYLDASHNEDGFNESESGDGDSFVFTFGSKADQRPVSDKLKVFPWTGKNRSFRLLSVRKGLGMGSGPRGFAFMLDPFLEYGSSSRSDTYDNECLASEEQFKCINFEVFTCITNLRNR